MKIRVQNVTKNFRDFTAVKDVSLTIEDGKFHFLVGPSGSGKTTLLRIIAGLEKVSSGHIYFDEKDVTDKAATERGVGMVFQNYALWPHMKVVENITYALKIRNLSQKEIKERLEEMLEITQLGDLQDRYPSELSGGQQQRVAVARALAIRPKVLLLDEPLSNQDAKLREEMRDDLIKIHRKVKITTLYITHDQEEALSMGELVTVINKGRILQTSTPRDLYLHPQSEFVADFIGSTNFIKGIVKEILKDENEVTSISVMTSVGLIWGSNFSGSFKIGDSVTLSIRPESVKIDLGRHDLKDKVNVLVAKLTSTLYLGEVERLLLTLQDGNSFEISLFNAPDHAFNIGQTIKCFLKPSKITVLSRNSLIYE